MRFFSDIKKYWNYAIVAAKAQLESEVANSYLNWLWWIIEPLCMMLVYSFIFGTIFGMKESNYSVFIFLALSLYDFFSRCIKSSVKIVKRNKQIVTKVYIPKFILIISDMLVNGFKMLMCLLVTFVMMLIYKVPITLNILYIIPILIALFCFTFAVCVYLTHIGVFVEDMSNIINIVLKLLFYFTGVFYSIKTKFPAPYNMILLKIYPVAALIDMARDCALYAKGVNMIWILCIMIVSVLLAALGVHVIYKNENTYVKVI